MTLSMCPFCGEVYDAEPEPLDERHQRLIAKGEEINNVHNNLHSLLLEFAAPSDSPKAVQNQLFKILHSCDELFWLADMLDPKGQGNWKLELKRRRRGRKSKWAPIDTLLMANDYEKRVEELKRDRARSPGKQALTEIAKEHKLDNDAAYKLIKSVWREQRKWKGRNST